MLEPKQRSYYVWLKRSEVRSQKSVRDKETARVIETVFLSNKKTYGYHKMKKALEQQGLFISEYRIRNLMRRNGMYPVTVRKYKPGRSRTLGGRFSDNILKQNFVSDKPFQKLAGDISYIKTKKGWVYLATVVVLFNREILGYAVSQSMGREMVKEAMGNAIVRSGGLKNAVFHSDRGIQYSSESFKRLLDENGIIQSMSKGGCPYDNACSESFLPH